MLLKKIYNVIEVTAKVYDVNRGTYTTTLFYEYDSATALGYDFLTTVVYDISHLYGFRWYNIDDEEKQALIKATADSHTHTPITDDTDIDNIIDILLDNAYNDNDDDDDIIKDIIEVIDNYSNTSVDVMYPMQDDRF